MFHCVIGRTRVPTFGREWVRPLADKRRIASRTAVRDTPNSSWMRGSVGRMSLGRYLPDTIRRPIVPATLSERLPCRARAGIRRDCLMGTFPALTADLYIILSFRRHNWPII